MLRQHRLHVQHSQGARASAHPVRAAASGTGAHSASACACRSSSSARDSALPFSSRQRACAWQCPVSEAWQRGQPSRPRCSCCSQSTCCCLQQSAGRAQPAAQAVITRQRLQECAGARNHHVPCSAALGHACTSAMAASAASRASSSGERSRSAAPCPLSRMRWAGVAATALSAAAAALPGAGVALRLCRLLRLCSHSPRSAAQPGRLGAAAWAAQPQTSQACSAN